MVVHFYTLSSSVVDIMIVLQICHVLQNECHFKEAVEFMESHSSSWESCTSFMYAY